ncbi:MAG: ribosomal protein S12 methylthiotransferase RimO [Elusimicrobia bacterium GWA2_56_46]|nr:MAG: ribosomal protein S12 methylthiotransferase RimO [Elusimicrobia bacterium GWA2_56_46]OGR56204.1 MAG: ribosomal protein S12 methylthiotransferase RimO [Elusimicrobia bacterium GWC2_56_31]HBB66967.1 30S ribosomal protein S12 methylthiotransferase RimO [Elusimicrobiota bacterium]HBW23019.1 30S ribosomal protein S12 methylthiotransferase RimO [Elusimicrobiota bacterium]
MPKVFIVSLGCPKNLTDAEVMAGHLAAAGYELTADKNKADVVLINTCAFLSSAARESEAEINRFISLKKRGKISKIAVTGCLVEREKDSLLKRFPQIDAVAGINALDRIASALDGGGSHILPATLPLAAPKLKVRLTAPHSAYLKIADGCDNHCSYCAIPMIRGRFRSKPMEDVIDEAKNLAGSGAREISLIAQDTTSYGLDLYGRPRLYELLKELIKIPGVDWLRLMYVYPEKLSSEILKFMRDEEKIVHYLDLPLQHISDNVLKKMNRRSTESSIKRKLASIRKLVPDIALRTSFISGFPGETEKDFKKLLAFTAGAGFDNVAVFAYSREPGTPAARLPGQIPETVKTARMNELITAQSRVVDRINLGLAGKTVKVLMDSGNFGRTYRDAPEIDGKVEVIPDAIGHKPDAIGRKTKKTYGLKPTAYGSAGAPPTLKAGDFINVKITGAAGYLRRGTEIR